MFPAILVVVISLLNVSSCAPSVPINNNDPGGHRCYSCASVDKPYLCNVTTQCRPDEQCYTDEHSTNRGSAIFSVGCRRISECYSAFHRRSDSGRRDVKVLKCEECCDGNLCNAGGCSAGVLTVGKGNVCYSCRFINDPRRCVHETRCQADEQCYIAKVLTQNFAIKYILGCVENAECETLNHFGPPVGKRDTAISTMCASCCNGDKCNDVCFPQGIPPTSLTTPKHHSTTQSSHVTTSPSMTSYTTFVESSGVPTTMPPMTKDTTSRTSYTSTSRTKDTSVTSAVSSTSPSTTKDTTVFHTTSGTHSSLIPKSSVSAFSTIGHTVKISPWTTIVETSGALSTMPPLTKDTLVIDTTSGISSTSTSQTKDTTVFHTTNGAPSTRPSTTKDTTVFLTTSGTHSSLIPQSSVSAFSTMGHTVTISPLTSTTPSKSTHGTTPGNEPLSTVCHKECAGSMECHTTEVQICRSPTPYCFTQLDIYDSGNYNISKRCAERNTCNDKWLKQTQMDNRCLHFNPGMKDTFTCYFCCTSHKCNMQSFPPYMSSLYKGND
ncbi:mucin-22-like [Haliotis cracherodii]|uniref:mucin-22-like n=1 Tax=Haliotis cracherodii TaxID=6455 RepID=UPI0039E7695E